MNILKKALLFLNGEPPSNETLREIKGEAEDKETLIIAADGAFSYIKEFFLPDIVIGDFDSLSREEIPSSVKVIELSKEKDFTDGHIAVEYIVNSGVKNAVIYGATGKRADHTLSNFSLLAQAKEGGVNAVLDTDDFLVHYAYRHFVGESREGKIVSLVPCSDLVHIIYTKGLKYPIHDRVLNKIHILGISNVATTDQIEFFIKSGAALVFLEK